jgi:hypothetical protein
VRFSASQYGHQAARDKFPKTNVACTDAVQPATSVLYHLWYKPNLVETP